VTIRPPWERAGSTARERLTELVELCEVNKRPILSGEFGDGMETTDGAAYPLPVVDMRAVLDELAAAETRGCSCCVNNACDCVNSDLEERHDT
jgi:hypothetical protein